MDTAASRLIALSPRARRALALMGVAVVVIAIAAMYFVRPHVLQQPSPATAHRLPVQRASDVVTYVFSGASVGWAVQVPSPAADVQAAFVIFKTVDGARHWSTVLSGQTQIVWVTVSSLHFVDPSHGFVIAGVPLSLLRTSDGGRLWSSSALPSQEVVEVHFFDPLNGWAWTAARDIPNPPVHLYWTFDAGLTWSEGPSVPAQANPIPAFRDRSEGWLGSSDPRDAFVYVTADAGTTWVRRDLPPVRDSRGGVSTYVRLLPGRGVIVYAGGSTFTSFDGGQTWQSVINPGGGLEYPLYVFEDATRWWTVEGLYLYRTIDAGQSWTAVTQASGLEVLQVLDSKHAWGRLDEGYGTALVFTADGGLHWNPVNVPSPA